MTNKQTFTEQKNLLRKKYPHLTEEQLDELTRRGFLKGLGAAAATYGGVSFTNTVIDEVREGKKRFITIKRGDSKADVLQKMGDTKTMERIKGPTGPWGTKSTWIYNGVGTLTFYDSKVYIIDYINAPLNKYKESVAQQDLLNQLNEYRQTQQLDEIGGPGLLKRAAGAITTGIGKADAYAQKALDKVDDASSYNPYKDNPIGDRSQQTYTGVGGAQIGKNPKSSNLTQKNQAATIVANDLKRVEELLNKLNEQKRKMFNMRSLNEALSPEETKELAGLLSKHVAKSQDPKYAKLFSAGNAYLQKASGEAQRKAGLEKKLGTTGAAATAANTAKTATNKSIARNQKKLAKQNAIGQGIKTARQPTRKVGPQRDSTGKIISTGSGVQRDSKGKVISNTAQNVSTKTNVPSAKIAGQKLDFNDPKNANLLKQIKQKTGT